MRICKSLPLLLLMCFPSPSFADSDGAFCIGPDYLAFQLSLSLNPGDHRLYVMRFGDPTEWKNPSSVILPYFSAPQLRCEATAIHLGADTVHVVSWDPSAPRTLRHRTVLRTVESEAKGYPDTLGSLSEGMPGPYGTKTFALPGADGRHSYELEVSKERDPANPCIRRVRSRVHQKSGGEVVETHELIAMTHPAECGE